MHATETSTPPTITLAELFEQARTELPPGGILYRSVTTPEWEKLTAEAFAVGAPYVSPEPSQALYSELRLVHPAMRRCVYLTVDD